MNQASKPLTALKVLFLSADPLQQIYIKFTLITTLVYGVCSALLAYGVWMRVAEAEETYLLIAAMLLSNLIFLAALRSGWNQRFRDRSLTMPQIIAALSWCACAYGVANEAHGGMLMPLSLVLVFGVFNLSPKSATIASFYALFCMGSVMLYKALTDPEVYNPHVQVAFFIMTMTIIPTIAGITAMLDRMRRRIKTQKAQLVEAMQRFQTSGEVPPLEGSAFSQAQDRLWLQFAELAQQRRDLEERRSMMLAAISHDLRSPLGRIRMAAELLPESQDVEVRRESITRNVDVATRLLTNFIDMARVDHEPIDGRLDLRELVLDAADEWPELQIKALPEHAQWLEPASAVALERVLRNLIDNAQIHGAGPLEMGLTGDAQPMLWLRDHGPGVDPALYEHFLQPFTRAEVNRMKPGTGLGLAIVQRTMVRHGGRVVLVNAQPGLRVELHFPGCQGGKREAKIVWPGQ